MVKIIKNVGDRGVGLGDAGGSGGLLCGAPGA